MNHFRKYAVFCWAFLAVWLIAQQGLQVFLAVQAAPASGRESFPEAILSPATAHTHTAIHVAVFECLSEVEEADESQDDTLDTLPAVTYFPALARLTQVAMLDNKLSDAAHKAALPLFLRLCVIRI